jgi:sugar O-acyltransferase (sialic acid O-acetyltransferase NeuD family)
MQGIIIVGAGGQGAIVADILLRAAEAGADARPLGFVDDTPALLGTQVLGLPVLGDVAALPGLARDLVIVAIGDNAVRRRLSDGLVAAGERLARAIHPFTAIAPSASLGDGVMVSAGALVLPRARIGRGVLLNSKSSVDHDTVVGDFAHVSAGATVGARSRIGAETLVALGASVTSGMTVGARCVVGAGAVVVRDLPDDVTAWGVPARPITSDRRSRSSSP